VAGRAIQSRPSADPATLIGAGKVQELATLATGQAADLVIFGHDLSPTQLRNLEKALPCRVIDRTQLILDIFARRARTREGQLQVELAQLNYLLPRLTGRGAAMSRLGGGIGTRGPGETKLETDRRRIHQRIQKVHEQLEAVRATRGVQRRQRRDVPLSTVALIGYTNAGKSTLFNRLTGAGVVADARLFATLDPTVRQLDLPSRRPALISDTVGFIRDLPASLVKAFRATLEEVSQAALLLHVVDATAPAAAERIGDVRGVLEEIGAREIPQLLAINKIDALAPEDRAGARAKLAAASGLEHAAEVSARTGEGVEAMLAKVDALLPREPLARVVFRLPAADGAGIHLVHELGRVRSARYERTWCVIEADAPESLIRRMGDFVVTR
jgi:GTP-binding protein HflX